MIFPRTALHKGRRDEEPYSTISATALPQAVVSALPPRSLVRSVRSPSVRSIAATIDAAAVFSPRCSSIMAPDQIMPIGLAMPCPAISGAEPCTGSNTDGKCPSGLILPDGAMPMVPVQAGPRSERMSPNRFEPTTTSNQSGCSTKFAVRISNMIFVPLHLWKILGHRLDAFVPIRHGDRNAVGLG